MWVGTDWAIALGYASIASWLIPGAAQLIENYKLKSGEGLSLIFVYIWLAGDLLNGVGALRQGLLSTIVYLAFWYVLTDLILLGQVLMYSRHPTATSTDPESESLLSPTEPSHDYGSNGTRSSEVYDAMERDAQAAAQADAEEQAANDQREGSLLRIFTLYSLGFLFISAVGIAGRMIQGPAERPDPSKPHDFKWDAQLFGWISAALYLSSRIPQIIKNRTTKCEGLSMSLFVFAVIGNATYVASILAVSLDPWYLLESLSWLVGSGTVIFLDFVVLYQFLVYAPDRRRIHLDRLVEEYKRRNQSAVQV